MIKILTVCLGNICRSPIAEAVLKKKCEDLGLQVFLDSSGTADYHIGCAPDKRMIETALQFGYDISTLRARQFKPTDFDRFDYIFTMDRENQKNILHLAKQTHHTKKVHNFQDFAGIKTPDFVPDPYYGNEKNFIETFNIIEISASRIADKLKSIHL